MVPGGMGFGVGAGFEYLGAEFVTHEDVAVQIDLHAARAAATWSLISSTWSTVSGEMQVGAADSTRSHTDQHLTGSGHRLGHVVPVDHPAVT